MVMTTWWNTAVISEEKFCARRPIIAFTDTLVNNETTSKISGSCKNKVLFFPMKCVELLMYELEESIGGCSNKQRYEITFSLCIFGNVTLIRKSN